MASDDGPARTHIQAMELRIRHQLESIEQLEQCGKDTAVAAQRLTLLRRALDEMRIQLAHLSPTDRDRLRPGAPPLRLKPGA